MSHFPSASLSRVCLAFSVSLSVSLSLCLSPRLSRFFCLTVYLSHFPSVSLPRLSRFFSVSLSLCLTFPLSLSPIYLAFSLSHCLCPSVSLSLSLSPSHCLCLSLSQSPCLTVSPFAPQTTQPSLTGPCNYTNCIACEVGTGFSNTIQTAQHKNTALFNFHYCITLYMFHTYSSLSRAAWPWAIPGTASKWYMTTDTFISYHVTSTAVRITRLTGNTFGQSW